MMPTNKLPPPSKEAIEHSNNLVASIKKYANKQTSLSFAQFMQQTLYTPQLGYYSNSLQKIGEKGDFITSPEISPLFSKCLARQAKQVLEQLSSPNIIEFGAGRGIMARDILLELEQLKQPLDNYYIIELSAELKLVQQQTLSSLPNKIKQKVVWLDKLPPPLSAVVLANEVLDAMPVERLKFMPSSISQAFVKIVQGDLSWDYQPITNRKLKEKAEDLLQYIGSPSPDGYETEVNLNIEPWIASINDFLNEGLLLIIDYGYSRQEYYQPARVMGTLRCHYQHLAHNDPFFYPGLQDITAHVDFTAVAEAGFNVGFNIDGFTTQAHFLMASGLLGMSEKLTLNTTESIKIAQQIKTLTMPNEMGESFKVIALTKNIIQPLIGFQLQNLLHTL
jgi:SAM-dependent MidA family methyltransferase